MRACFRKAAQEYPGTPELGRATYQTDKSAAACKRALPTHEDNVPGAFDSRGSFGDPERMCFEGRLGLSVDYAWIVFRSLGIYRLIFRA